MSDVEIEPIEPDAASRILNPVLEDLEAEGWQILVQTDYMARLTRADKNLDVRVDLLGHLQMEEKPLTLTQESGKIVAIVLFLVMILFVLTLITILDLVPF